jgi:8-oxo-dGTP pyrophosphatase MutT (NUDIX family)
MKLFAVTVLLFSTEGKILSVSRKTNLSDFNLPGGKIDSTDESPLQALFREVMEETGLDISAMDIEELYEATDCDNYLCRTYLVKDTIEPSLIQEGQRPGEGVVAWKEWKDITSDTATYHEYNIALKLAYERV